MKEEIYLVLSFKLEIGNPLILRGGFPLEH